MKTIKIKFHNLTIFFILTSLLCGYIKSTLIVLFIIIFHECGHVFISIVLGYKVDSIEILPFGGITKIDKLLNNSIYKDALISIFGIVFQCILFLIKDPLLYKYNLSIIIFNMLPIIPLDGSKLLFEILNILFNYRISLIIYYFASIIFIFIYVLLNYQYMLNNYLIISLFIVKTIESIKNHSIICNKFILERYLYDDIKYHKIINKNEKPINYHKDVKYYYKVNNRIISESEYLRRKVIDKNPYFW